MSDGSNAVTFRLLSWTFKEAYISTRQSLLEYVYGYQDHLMRISVTSFGLVSELWTSVAVRLLPPLPPPARLRRHQIGRYVGCSWSAR